MSGHPDYLKEPNDIFVPDPRSNGFVQLAEGGRRKMSIEDHLNDISTFSMGASVPESVRIHFETAKNLYLYAWFVYRFYPVAEHHALACLELALRTRCADGIPVAYWPRQDRPPTLRPLLRYAIDTGLIKNEGFRRWHDHVRLRAERRYSDERYREMVERDLTEIVIDYANAVPNKEDRNWDYLPILLETLPEIRNAYAHGSTMLHNQVLGTLELVCEIVNQVFALQPNAYDGTLNQRAATPIQS